MALILYQADVSDYDIFELQNEHMGCLIAKGRQYEPDEIATGTALPTP